MIMYPCDLGIKTPLAVVHLYGDGAYSLGDGMPVVTEYPCPPMSALELFQYMGFGRRKPRVPPHVKKLKNQFPDLFEAHAESVMQQRLGEIYRVELNDV